MQHLKIIAVHTNGVLGQAGPNPPSEKTVVRTRLGPKPPTSVWDLDLDLEMNWIGFFDNFLFMFCTFEHCNKNM